MPNDEAQGAAIEQIASITVNPDKDDIGDFSIFRSIGVEMPHDKPPAGACIGGIKNYNPTEMTIGRRLTTNRTIEAMVKVRTEMATPRNFTFRLIRGNDRSVSRSISATKAHLLKYWIETIPDGDGHHQPYEFVTFQPEGITFG